MSAENTIGPEDDGLLPFEIKEEDFSEFLRDGYDEGCCPEGYDGVDGICRGCRYLPFCIDTITDIKRG